MKKPVTIINSYAGSLTIAAADLKLDIRGSYEDSGFGIKYQKMNFPNLNYVDCLLWPKVNLRGQVVIAHPPCSAFSRQIYANSSLHNSDPARIRGAGADAFKCTQRVMKYAMENNCDALAIESVKGAMEGGRAVHDRFARKYGYNAFRILQNAATFGAPQWRERFWIVFSRREKLELRYVPQVRRIGEVFKFSDGGAQNQHYLERQVALLRDYGMDTRKIRRFLNGDLGYGRIDRVLEMDDADKKKYCVNGKFSSFMYRVLDPEKFTPVLMHASMWIWRGKHASDMNYKRAMGFPHDYVMPGHFKMYLSKGVCPPVARWILENLATDRARGEKFTIHPDGMLDLQVKRAAMGA